MAVSTQKISFSTPLVRLHGQPAYHALILPQKIVSKLPTGRLRASGLINETEFDLGINYLKTGERYLTVSKVLMKKACLTTNQMVKVSFTLIPFEIVPLPEELEAMIEQDEEGGSLWKKLSPGTQRSLAHYVNSAKSIDVRINRALSLLNRLKAGTLLHQHKKAKNDE